MRGPKCSHREWERWIPEEDSGYQKRIPVWGKRMVTREHTAGEAKRSHRWQLLLLAHPRGSQGVSGRPHPFATPSPNSLSLSFVFFLPPTSWQLPKSDGPPAFVP